MDTNINHITPCSRMCVLGNDIESGCYSYCELEKWFPLQGERAHYIFCMHVNRKEEEKTNNNRSINLLKVITFFTDYKYTT